MNIRKRLIVGAGITVTLIGLGALITVRALGPLVTVIAVAQHEIVQKVAVSGRVADGASTSAACWSGSSTK